MPTVEELLRALNESQTRLSNYQPKTWKQKQKAKKEYENNETKIAQLKKYQDLKLNDWVTNQKEVGQVLELYLSPGGMPQIWVNWNNSLPEIVHRLDLLLVLEENWNHGFSLGDLVLLGQDASHPQQSGKIVKFLWSKEHNCVLPSVEAEGAEEEILVGWENLSLAANQELPEVNQTQVNQTEVNQTEVEEQYFFVEMLQEQRSSCAGGKFISTLSSAPLHLGPSATVSTIEIIIDEEFKSLIPVLSPEEKSQLENNLISEGCRDPLVIWKGYNILLDGHNRYEICVKNGINYELIEIELPSREEAHLWMMRNQLGRRNLQPEALSYFRGKLQAALKKKIKNPTGKNQYSEVKCKNDPKPQIEEDEVKGHFDPKPQIEEKEVKGHFDPKPQIEEKEVKGHFDPKPHTAEKLADEFKVSPKTIKRDAQYAKAVDQITELVGSDIRPKILSKTTGRKLTKKKTLELAKKAKRKPEEVIEYFNPGTSKKFNPAEIKPFPFQVGEVVRIIPKNHPNLRGKGGYWAIITQIYYNCCDLQLWNGKVELISADHLVSLKLTPSECEQMKALCDRLSSLREVANDALVHHNLQFLGRLKHPKLTTVQETILGTIENIYQS